MSTLQLAQKSTKSNFCFEEATARYLVAEDFLQQFLFTSGTIFDLTTANILVLTVSTDQNMIRCKIFVFWSTLEY
jgi:hypothetical protein